MPPEPTNEIFKDHPLYIGQFYPEEFYLLGGNSRNTLFPENNLPVEEYRVWWNKMEENKKFIQAIEDSSTGKMSVFKLKVIADYGTNQ